MLFINQVRLLISKFYFKVVKTTSILNEVRECCFLCKRRNLSSKTHSQLFSVLVIQLVLVFNWWFERPIYGNWIGWRRRVMTHNLSNALLNVCDPSLQPVCDWWDGPRWPSSRDWPSSCSWLIVWPGTINGEAKSIIGTLTIFGAGWRLEQRPTRIGMRLRMNSNSQLT